MARSQSKSSVRRAQPAHRSVTTQAGRQANRDLFSLARLSKAFHFKQVKGKVVEDVEFTSCSDYHAISLTFRDKTCLDLMIDMSFTIQADYLDRKAGDRHVLKKWPLMHAVRFRSR